MDRIIDSNENFQEFERQQHRIKQAYELAMAKATPEKRAKIFKDNIDAICPGYNQLSSVPKRAGAFWTWVYQNAVLGDEIPAQETEYVVHGFSTMHKFEAKEVQLIAAKLPSWCKTLFRRDHLPVYTTDFKTGIVFERTPAGQAERVKKSMTRVLSGLKNASADVAILQENLDGVRLNAETQRMVEGLLGDASGAQRLLRNSTNGPESETKSTGIVALGPGLSVRKKD